MRGSGWRCTRNHAHQALEIVSRRQWDLFKSLRRQVVVNVCAVGLQNRRTGADLYFLAYCSNLKSGINTTYRADRNGHITLGIGSEALGFDFDSVSTCRKR